MPRRPLRLPHSNPATTVAMTPDAPTACAATKDPYAANVVSSTSSLGSETRRIVSADAAPMTPPTMTLAPMM